MRVESIRGILRLLPALGAAVLLVCFPSRAAAAAQEGVRQCLETVIPSLFPFFVLSRLITSGSKSPALPGRLSRLWERLFAVPTSAIPVFLLGLVSGYPVGASAAAELYRRGGCTRSEAERLLVFANNCGPGFLLGAAASRLPGGSRTAVTLLLLQALISIWLGILLGTGKPASVPVRETGPGRRESFSRSFTSAVVSGGRAVLNVCAYVVFFASITAFLPGLPLLRGSMELTGGLLSLPKGQFSSLIYGAFLLGFGGLSVGFQVLSALDGTDLSGKLYFPFRLLHGLVLACFAAISVKCPVLLPIPAAILVFSVFCVKKGRKRRLLAIY